MRELTARPGLLAAVGVSAAVAGGIVAALRGPESRANLVWTLNSWRRPADRNSFWQQKAGKRVDPLDRIKRGI